MTPKEIYSELRKAGMSKAGACGLMGNMQAESAMKANNAQDGMTRLSDAEYTAAVDNGTYTRFATDGVGYGYVQLTFSTRKRAYLEFAKSKGKSIGDGKTQIDFIVKELKTDYPTLWAFLCSTDSLYNAASRVCKEYERPAVHNIETRAAHAQSFFNEFSGVEIKPVSAEVQEIKKVSIQLEQIRLGVGNKNVKSAQLLLNGWGLDCGAADGIFGSKTDAAVKAFQEARGLSADGIIGAQTWAALHEG